MMTRQRFVLAGLQLLLAATAAFAAQADVPRSVVESATCAPPPAAAQTGGPLLQVVGGQDTRGRSVFGVGEPVVVNGGTAAGVAVDQQYVVRRSATLTAGRDTTAHPVATVARVRVVAANETTAIAQIEVMCDAVLAGDHLEPYTQAALPVGIERTDASGELDFSNPARVLFGPEERVIGGTGDFMVADLGEQDGIVPGARLAIYRDVQVAGVPLTAVGEAIVTSVGPDRSVFRITDVRDAVQAGDLLIRRR